MLEVTSKVMVKMALIGVNRQVLNVATSNKRPADTPLLHNKRPADTPLLHKMGTQTRAALLGVTGL